MRSTALFLLVLPLACAPAAKTEPIAPTAAPAAPGSFEEQVQLGERAYLAACVECHGKTLKGGNRAPSLLGKKALGKNALDTFDYLKGNMPPNGAGKLTDADYWNLTAFLVRQHGWPVQGRLTPESAASVKP
jgi:mono/diheme cytochrome c family protein